MLVCAWSTEVVQTVGDPCENPVETPVTATESIEWWLHAQAPYSGVGAASCLMQMRKCVV